MIARTERSENALSKFGSREVTPENGKSAFLRCGKLPETTHRNTYRFATFQPFAIRLDTETITYNRDDSVDLFVRNAAAPERRRLSPWGSWHVNAYLVDETILEVDEVDLLFEI
jgi:hypothetical protein